MNFHRSSSPFYKNGHMDGCYQCDARHQAVCSAIEGYQLSELEAITVHKKVAAGHAVFEEGDPATHLYNISSGTLRIYKLLPDGRRQIIGFLFTGDFLGLAANHTYSYGAEAVSEVNLCQIRATDFQALMEKHPELRDRLLEMANDELIAAQDQMLLLGRKTPTEKLASFLLRMAHKNEKWHLAPSPVTLTMTREDIADYLGLTIETVSRTFTKLKNEGAIALGRSNQVHLSHMERLQELADTL